jgi:hypothetical protein
MDGYIINKVTSAAVNQYAPVKISTNLVAHFADDTDTLFGIATSSADSGAPVGVQVSGVAQVLVDGSGTAVVAGDLLMGGAAKLVKYASGTGHKAVARALEPTSVSKVIRVQLLADRQTADA